MIIKLSPYSPIDPSATLEIKKRSDVLTINGERYDFRPLPEGATLPMEAISGTWISQPVRRVDGELIITIRFPVGPEATAAALYPADIINPPDGNVRLPQ
ncbi:hypothetical protein JFT60_28580 [Pseudomonas sp. MF6772]|jgi:hypothetical protein|uniref:hypothetical protein n=1 Tax=unclassified Pseudomonas TaxID=196821 RepID=UPI0014744B74|nr:MULTISPECIES: hypothetical protein [unclassified Pseudomonas]MBJ2271335.1 hypothetical protein [Pseudomonas sp. MF6772]NMY04660.1 hypothetical protein [Pseudomonas sp. WS 5059]NMY06324.1 hypothetical protein [Pseudomonas sp. WS 5059]WLI36379.1 hypothetical protein PSH80_08615 [Pseudomonas sp. FP818]